MAVSVSRLAILFSIPFCKENPYVKKAKIIFFTAEVSLGGYKEMSSVLLTNSALVDESKSGGIGGAAGYQPMSTVQLCTSRDMEPQKNLEIYLPIYPRGVLLNYCHIVFSEIYRG